mmetsp:Transcript_60296/g.67407  ORF Transcript_60296/g.67407 Transcript_60296/m.67407 type:complete len:104 (+) Transcript_60296:1431-1742(+)
MQMAHSKVALASSNGIVTMNVKERVGKNTSKNTLMRWKYWEFNFRFFLNLGLQMTMSMMYYEEFQRVNWVFDVASSFFLSTGENKDQIIDECENGPGNKWMLH